MKISINNFKSIGSLVDYEMRPLTILSGTNSSGKSSFIQLLLLLKQSIEDDSAERILNLNGAIYPISEYLDIIKNNNSDNKLKIKLIFNKSELSNYIDFAGFNVYSALENYDLHINLVFDVSSEKKVIASLFEIKFDSKGEGQSITTSFENRDSKFSIKANRPLLINDISLISNGNSIVRKIHYSSFIPTEVEVENIEPKVEGLSTDPVTTFIKEVPKLEGIKALFKNFFGNINYVGAYRKDPQESYPDNGKNIAVGKHGENVAEVLYNKRDDIVTFYKLVESENGYDFIIAEDTFLNAVKYWICDRFRLCSDIFSKKEADSYVIYVKGFSGVISTIKHVGFGISQILPIVVESLRIETGQTLILEQPEVHLHPKVQSILTDFLISLIKLDKNVIIETHSDHLITRLRRRIAEDQSNQLDDKTLLTFVEVGSNDVLFNNITINDFGVIELPFPEDFIERTDIELKAILKAQMKKRLNKSEE